MRFTHEINRLLVALLLMFGVVALAAAYWAIFGTDTILLREDNPRLVEAEAAILRGAILDRNDTVLVESLPGASGVRRGYLYPEMASALGYYSLRYGVGGAEAAYNAILRGSTSSDDLTAALTRALMHQPQQGADIRLTLDLSVQRQIAEAMQGQRGAAVVLSVPDGAVLALVSLPTYDANTLDANWDTLVQANGNPFFNRVLQGSYQPGGALETALMAAAFLVDNRSVDATFDDATAPVTLGDTELTCAVRLPSMPLTLREAYGFGCPQPFAQLAGDLGVETLRAVIETLHVEGQPALPGFELPPPTSSTPAPTESIINADDLIEIALGQGGVTVNPLNMAMLAAAIVNDGNAPQPYLLVATRDPGAEAWLNATTVRPTIPLATANTARYLQDLMRSAVAQGAAQNAGRPDIDIGGHAALAYSGEGSLVWFVGFATFAGRQGAAVAIVLEDSDDPGLAADIGGTALAAAQDALAPPQ